MKITKWLAFIVIGLVAVVVTLGVLNIHKASAASSIDKELTSVLSRSSDPRSGIRGATKADLAEALGITEEELDTAIQVAKEAAITQGVDGGIITQAQADELMSRESGTRLDRALASWLAKSGVDFQALLADALGITVDELQSAVQQAVFARLDQAVDEGNLTEEQALLAKGRYSLVGDGTFQSSMQSAFQAAVEEAVENGVITQEQADLILERASLENLHGRAGAFDFLGLSLHRERPIRGGRGEFPGMPDYSAEIEP